MAAPEKKEDGWGGWALIILLFAFGVWPIALVLLFAKLFGSDTQRRRAAPPPLQTSIPYKPETAARAAAPRQTKAKSAAKKVVKSPVLKKSNAAWLKVAGCTMAFVGLATAADPAGMVFAGYAEYWLWEMLQWLGVAAGGAAMFAAGVSMDRAMKRFTRYLAVMGDQEAISVDQLSRKLGYAEKRVERDLQKMIDKGYFGGKAYLNQELGYFFRSGEADAAMQRQRAEANRPQSPKETEEGYSGILRSIRRANDRIADPILTAKIDHLEEITAKIFRAVEEDPKKATRIDTFLNYYLPTTQKLLDSYAEFESTGIEGENLRQAKERIEKTMDSIVAGFEHQLDELYKADAMDVDSDIRVMETMLRRDTASVERDFGLGTAAPAAPKAPKITDIDLGGAAAQTEEHT